MRRAVRLIPAVAWMILIFILSSQQRFPSPGGLRDDVLAAVAHLFLFGTLALLLVLAIPDPPTLTGSQSLLIVASVVAYGITDEIHQSFVRGRVASVFDVVVDGIGATAAIGLWLVFSKFTTR